MGSWTWRARRRCPTPPPRWPGADGAPTSTAGRFEVVQAEPGQPLLKEGKEAEYLYLIRSGDVEVYRRIRGRRIALEILRPGDLLGRISRADGAPSGFGARALSPVTAIRIRGEALRWLLKTRPALAERFVEYLAGRLERMRRRVEELAGGDLRTRTAALLYDETRGSPASI